MNKKQKEALFKEFEAWQKSREKKDKKEKPHSGINEFVIIFIIWAIAFLLLK